MTRKSGKAKTGEEGITSTLCWNYFTQFNFFWLDTDLRGPKFLTRTTLLPSPTSEVQVIVTISYDINFIRYTNFYDNLFYDVNAGTPSILDLT